MKGARKQSKLLPTRERERGRQHFALCASDLSRFGLRGRPGLGIMHITCEKMEVCLGFETLRVNQTLAKIAMEEVPRFYPTSNLCVKPLS